MSLFEVQKLKKYFLALLMFVFTCETIRLHIILYYKLQISFWYRIVVLILTKTLEYSR